MYVDVSARARAPFLQTPEALIDDTELSDAALRLLLALVKLPPRNGRNSETVARALRMGKDKTNSARRALRTAGHWHARKRQHADSGEIGDQRLATLTPLRTADEIAAGWAAAEEAARLGKDTAESRRLGVRILNSAAWYPRTGPAAGSAVPRADRRRPLEGGQTESSQTHRPGPEAADVSDVPDVPAVPGAPEACGAASASAAQAPAAKPKPEAKPLAGGRARTRAPLPELAPLTGALAAHAVRGEQVLLGLRRHDPPLPLTVAEARELAQVAGHYLLRGETPESLRAVLTQGLPPDGVRCPYAFVRQRLIRYLPPEPARAPQPGPGPASGAVASAAEPAPPRPDGPVARLTEGHGWRAAIAAATDSV